MSNDKIAFVSSADIIKAFYDPNEKVFTKLKLVDVPEDTEIVYGWFDVKRNSFGLRLRHESFPLVPDYEIPSIVLSEIEYIIIKEKE